MLQVSSSIFKLHRRYTKCVELWRFLLGFARISVQQLSELRCNRPLQIIIRLIPVDPIRSVNVCPHEHPLINLDQLLGLHTGKLPKSWGQKPADVIRFTRWKTTALSNSYSGPAKLREEVTILMITQPWLFGFESSTWPNYKTSWGTEHWSSLHLLHEVYCLLRRERWEPVKLRLKIVSLKATRPSKNWANVDNIVRCGAIIMQVAISDFTILHLVPWAHEHWASWCHSCHLSSTWPNQDLSCDVIQRQLIVGHLRSRQQSLCQDRKLAYASQWKGEQLMRTVQR